MNASTISEFRRSRTLVLIVVTIAMLLDSLMNTVVRTNSNRGLSTGYIKVPILPNYLNTDATTKTNIVDNDSNKEPLEKVSSGLNGSALLGLLLASKSIFQIIVGPFVGILTDKVGFSIPMLAGFLVTFISTLMFAFSESYHLLFAARSIQGISTSLSIIPSLAMLSNAYPDDEERGIAMAKTFTGLTFGVTVGPIFGAFFYENFGKPAPFLIIAGFALIDGCLRLLVSNPKLEEDIRKEEGPSLITLMKDPYIMICAGSCFLIHFGTASIESSLPLHMMGTMNASSIQQGLVYLPIGLTRLLVNTSIAKISFSVGRYLTVMLGLVLSGTCLVLISFCKNVIQLILTTIGIGLSVSLMEVSIMPLLSHVVDVRYAAVYGCVFAISDMFFSLTFCVGPMLGGFLAEEFGFKYSLWLISSICFLYSPLLYFLRHPPARDNMMRTIPKNYRTFEEEIIMQEN